MTIPLSPAPTCTHGLKKRRKTATAPIITSVFKGPFLIISCIASFARSASLSYIMLPPCPHFKGPLICYFYPYLPFFSCLEEYPKDRAVVNLLQQFIT